MYLLLPVGAQCDGQEQQDLHRAATDNSRPKALIMQYFHAISWLSYTEEVIFVEK
jgi:hypothetical protein